MSVRRLRVALAIFVVAGAAGAVFFGGSTLDLGNGRIEADEIDIDTKFAGRIAEIRADQGDMVKSGQVVARRVERDRTVIALGEPLDTCDRARGFRHCAAIRCNRAGQATAGSKV
jgi:multidrug efflux pump subunit AcrA (membrane-fusion protein)